MDRFDEKAKTIFGCLCGFDFYEGDGMHESWCPARFRAVHAAGLRDLDAAKQREIDELQQPMECGHYGANLQPDDANADVCVVCAEIFDAKANARRETWEKAIELIPKNLSPNAAHWLQCIFRAEAEKKVKP